MQLSPHFSYEELTVTHTGLDNVPDKTAIAWLRLVANKLEEVRALLGDHPIKVNSGYRSVAVNHKVHGAYHSAHLWGRAADIVHPIYSPLEVCQRIASSRIQFDQLIHEFTWTHLAISDDNKRRSILTAYMVHDRVSYREGL